MDAVTNVLLGVLSNALYSLLISPLAAADVKRTLALLRSLKKDQPLMSTLQKASAGYAQSLNIRSPVSEEQVKLVLVSPGVESVLRQLYVARLSDSHSLGEHLDALKQEFSLVLSRSGAPGNKLKAEAIDYLFGGLVNACDRALTIAIDNGCLAAHEASSNVRHKVVLSELASIQRRIDILKKSDSTDITAFLNFEIKYRSQVAARHQFISPPHFEAARKVAIDKLYVAPTIVSLKDKKREEPLCLELRAFFSTITRTVLLGNPGGGKSTLSLRLCYDLAKQYEGRIVAGRELTPVLVILREYGAEKKSRGLSIIQFLEGKANSAYQVASPPGAFEYLLVAGRALVIFDGLDELTDTSYKQEISADIESFCNLYPDVSVLVTSREVGYQEAPLDTQTFELFRLADFDDKQIKEYVTKWFSADPELTPGEQTQKVKAFLKESAVVSDLRANPLMLALMCSIYRGEGYIPRNRPDVYEKCALMLFERWDKGRGINIDLPFEAHVHSTMKHLAYWIYSDTELQTGVTESALVVRAADYLLGMRYEQRDEAEHAAKVFITFCRGRAWVFSDVGTTRDGEHLYQFTHRTFLEYFTAAHLVRNYATPEQIKEVLFLRIGKGEWDVVAQLCFQLQNKNLEGAGDALLNSLLEDCVNKPANEMKNVLSFSARCIQFLVPRPKTVKAVTRAVLTAVISWATSTAKEASQRPELSEHAAIEILSPLLRTAVENRPVVMAATSEFLTNGINDSAYVEAVCATEIAMNLTIALNYVISDVSYSREIEQEWDRVIGHIAETCKTRIRELAEKSLIIGLILLWRGGWSISEFVQCHETQSLFQNVAYRVFAFVRGGPLAQWLVRIVLMGPYRQEWSANDPHLRLSQLSDLGDLFSSTSPPWCEVSQVKDIDIFYGPWLEQREKVDVTSPYLMDKLNASAKFAMFVVHAMYVEAGQKRSAAQIKNHANNHVIVMLGDLLLAREHGVMDDKLSKKLQATKFTPGQREQVVRWITKQVSFLAKG